tara:strand:+ start:544 stop:1182 length:639 start_codon:yes stop_codon:yes gene_type:complete
MSRQSKTNTTDEFIIKTNKRGRKIKVRNPNYRPPTAKDKDDARKESELAGVLKNKPKGGYKDTSPKPKTEAIKIKKKPYVDPDAADKEAEKVFRSSSSGKVAKERHDKIAKSQIKGEGPVTDRKKYGKTLKKEGVRREAEAKAKWLKKTRNSPAARAGIGDDKRYNLHKKNKDFQAHKKAGTLDKFAKKYPDSQTAKRRKKRLRIPSPMDMD